MPFKFGRYMVLGAVLAATAATPAVALAKHGADDGPGDDRGGRQEQGDDNGGRRDRDRDEKRVAGRCDGRSTSKLKVKHDDGRIEAEFEVDQNRNGVTWGVQLRRNGRVVVSTSATTRAPSGSFSVERKLARGSGSSDRISARAVSPSGEVCSAAATL
ncbi:hypothetical protein Q5424_07140 [Conexibacter sp. JD483]|uniref:hypothetical protein n=1 Tax=unclassified Conexibacter TaxID=2627773 RepID=UPI00271F192F|nr:MULTISPECIES: hypothetical protein [unclassified Conexibacter]MDO8186970.1 hypothetical protein [Conexibacter sp. CPCC 205706]MDO8200575.1 hypothetical protein [Conexibacter sp. CPCC 205762]MDR9368847.1 hypothetical protein [Conexibacter sp. JD483]